MGTQKYFGEVGGVQHGDARLQWPGTPDGFPVLAGNGPPPNLKQEEIEGIDYRLDFKSKMFELWDEAQKAEFEDIQDKILNKWYALQKRSDHWDDEQKHYRVWLEWCQIYGVMPTK